MNRVMLDLETMGTASDSAIIAIGAVRFNTEGIVDRFYEIVDLQSCIDAGLRVDGSTVVWWMQQADQAREEFTKKGTHINSALQNFSEWIGDDAEVWGNGANFDNAILSSAYRICCHVLPWKFWNDRCYRTVKALHPKVKLSRVGTYHCAVDDAESQALHLISIFKAAGESL